MATLMTHVRQYTGPGTVPVLLEQQHALVCHDASFADPAAVSQFEAEYPDVTCLQAQTPEGIVEELNRRQIAIDTVIHNDVYPNTPLPIEDIPLSIFQESFAALYLFPMRLTQLLLPPMKTD